MEEGIGQELVAHALYIDLFPHLAISCPRLVTRNRLKLPNLSYLQLNQLPSLLLLLLLQLLLAQWLFRFPLDSDEVVEHSICILVHIFHPLIVDAH